MAISVLVGNGINRLANADASWENLLVRLANKGVTPHVLEHVADKPFALIYEELLLGMSVGNRETSETDLTKTERELKSEIAAQIAGLEGHLTHARLMCAGLKHVLTTNYDYALERASGLEFRRDNLHPENKYSVFRRRRAGNCNVWHIHGECESPATITLGYDQYSGYLQKLRGHATAERSSGRNSPFKARNLQFDGIPETSHSWLDVFFRDDIHIIGLGLDYTEIDLWWAIAYKARLGARGYPVGRTHFYDWHNGIEDNRRDAKHSLLSGMRVKVVSAAVRDAYEERYDGFLRTVLGV